ncbi:MAG: DUF2752 domain-containing protein [Candidatus Saccharibacteria bacterium]|nr:DUF2752 domain-containing protein [Candidatus Saccharibacteria bacterium]
MQTANRFKSKLLNVVGLQTPAGRLVAFAAVTAFVYVTSVFRITWIPNLSLYKYLGINAPSIGLTRAFRLLINGDVSGAWQMNWLIFPVVAIVLGIVIIDITKLMRKKQI